MLRKKNTKDIQAIEGARVFNDLREVALSITPELFEVPPPERRGILGVVIDVPSSAGSIALVAFSDGASSMYTSTGGGVIGAGQHESVKAVNSSLLDQLARVRSEFNAVDKGDYPTSGHVRFHLLTTDGRWYADLPLENFWKPSASVLNPVVAAVQQLIAAMRGVSSS